MLFFKIKFRFNDFFLHAVLKISTLALLAQKSSGQDERYWLCATMKSRPVERGGAMGVSAPSPPPPTGHRGSLFC